MTAGATRYYNAESKITHVVGYSLESRGRKKSTNKTTRKRVTQRCGTLNLSPNSDGGVQSGGELLSSHSTEGQHLYSLLWHTFFLPEFVVCNIKLRFLLYFFMPIGLAANDDDPSQQTRKRGRPRKTGGEPSSSHATEREPFYFLLSYTFSFFKLTFFV